MVLCYIGWSNYISYIIIQYTMRLTRYKNLKMDAQLLCLLIIIVDIVYIYGTQHIW